MKIAVVTSIINGQSSCVECVLGYELKGVVSDLLDKLRLGDTITVTVEQD